VLVLPSLRNDLTKEPFRQYASNPNVSYTCNLQTQFSSMEVTMLVHTISSASYFIAAVGLTAMARIKGNPRTMDFESGIAVGLAIAGLLDILTPWAATLS
jgi:hypothetical protein